MASTSEPTARNETIRRTDDGRLSLVDCIAAADVHPSSRRKAIKKTIQIIESLPEEERPTLSSHRFVAKRETLVGGLRDIARFISLMPMKITEARRTAVRALLLRLGGDQALVDETIGKTAADDAQDIEGPKNLKARPDDLEAQLATGLGCHADDLSGIRRTREGVASLIDVVAAFQNKSKHDARHALYAYCKDEGNQFDSHKFEGRGQRDTPVAHINAIYDVLMRLPDDRPLEAREKVARLLVRYLEDDFKGVGQHEEGCGEESCSSTKGPTMPKAYETTRLPGMCDPRHLYLGTSTSRADLVKVGVTERLGERAQEHARRAGDFQFFHVFFNAGCLEGRFKQVFAPYQEKIEIAGQTQTEYFRLSKEAAVAGVLTTAKIFDCERDAEATRNEQTMEREHKRKRLEIETASIEAEAQHKRRCMDMDADHKRRRLDCEARERAIFTRHLRALACARADEGKIDEAVDIMRRI